MGVAAIRAIHYAKEGIRANSIHPGLIDTLMAADLLADDELRQRDFRPFFGE